MYKISERMDLHEKIMKICVNEAKKAKGFTKTNPLVGAAVVNGGRLLSVGIHEKFGFAHAEVNALEKAGSNTFGADLFVTLEPCSSFGKTPPCVDKIVKCGIKRVFIGVVDVNPKHAGVGINKLREAGIEVNVGIGLNDCAMLAEDFIKSQTYKTPYVTLKIAVSADGKTATYGKDSKWITNETSRKLVHKMRGRADAVLTGIGTVLADDPMLNDRTNSAGHQPTRVVLDSLCRTPYTSALAKSAKDIPLILLVCEEAPKENIVKLIDVGAEVITIPSVGNGLLDLNVSLKTLYDKQMMNIFVETGATLAGSFYDLDLIDRLEEFIAPKIIGGRNAPGAFGGNGKKSMKEVEDFCSYKIKKSGTDILISAKLKDYANIAVDATRPFMKDY